MMLIKQLFNQCLSEVSYFVASGEEAIVIDPSFDIGEYLSLAKKHQVTIKYIFETHFHTDYVSGHLNLAQQTGAEIVYGPKAKPRFAAHLAKDGATFSFGELTLKVLHTPGHTPESTSYLLYDETGTLHCVFTGDTLLVGEVGKPYFEQGDMGGAELAELLFDSIQKLKELPGQTLVYPARVPNLNTKEFKGQIYTTIGEQKEENELLILKNRWDFVPLVSNIIQESPFHFRHNSQLNKEGYEPWSSVSQERTTPLSVDQFKKYMEREEAFILDVRQPSVFVGGFIPTTVNIGLKGPFELFVPFLLPYDRPIILVTDECEEEETVHRLAGIGYQEVKGYLKGGFEAWKSARQKTDMIIEVEPDELSMDLRFDPHLVLVDVRGKTAYDSKHVEKAINIPLETMANPMSMASFEERDNLYIHCQTGYCSVIACSMIKKQGYHNLRNVAGGFTAIKKDKTITLV